MLDLIRIYEHILQLDSIATGASGGGGRNEEEGSTVIALCHVNNVQPSASVS